MKKSIKKLIALLALTGVLSSSIVLDPIQGYAAEKENDAEAAVDEGELKENSWRYKDGERIYEEEPSPFSRSAVSNAWEKVNGQYVNSRGEVIEGATLKGIDISEHNGNIDWEKVKADGIDFAIIRCGFGQDQTNQDDKKWEYNVSECERLGIPYGVYLYSYATSPDRAKGEAEHVLRLLEGHSPSYPVYYDLEDDKVFNMTAQQKGQLASDFCNIISDAGYEVGIYSNTNWWTNYLTDSAFNNSNWSKWVAQYNYRCTYTGSYDFWQCSSTGQVNGINGNVDLNFFIEKNNTGVFSNPKVTYQSYVQDLGWQPAVQDGNISGTEGQYRRLEAMAISLERQGNMSGNIEYRSHLQSTGWESSWKKNGEESGAAGAGRRIEAIQIRLTGDLANRYDVYYRVHAQDYGWLGWTKNGDAAGSTGCSKYIQALQVVLVAKGGNAPGSTDNSYREPLIQYTTHVQDYGWQEYVVDGAMAGTSGESKRLEGIRIQLANQKYSGGVRYSTHVQDYGWQGYVENNQMAGTTGELKRLEAIKIELTGDMADHYDIYYRVHAQTFGWLGWAKNGEEAGTSGYSYRLEGIQIQLVEKGAGAPGSTEGAYRQPSLQYTTHVQDYGWQTYVTDGQMAGTSGESKRLEGIRIQLANPQYSGSIRYSTHVQDYGWQDFVENGAVSGTVGELKRLEAIRIELTGDMAAHYDIYYHVHAETYGWLGWAKNGEAAGTSGQSKRLEGIEIQLIPKGGSAPGSTENAYITQ